MSDSLYLSLWYPQLRLNALADKLAQVLDQFASHGGDSRVFSATTWPVSYSEAPAFQRIYSTRGIQQEEEGRGVPPRFAINEAFQQLHDDFAYEFQIAWNLWELEEVAGLDPKWVLRPRLVRVTGFGPEFDNHAYEQEGHIKIDFGSDSAFLQEDAELDAEDANDRATAHYLEENIRQLIELAAAVEKNSGATARLLWSELGESLVSRLIARLHPVQ